jgi:lipopolysaccharide/colanic/teichoic acid biosynthesis glycosyltransferase
MYKFIKRTFDIFLAFILMLILFPLLLPIIIILKLSGEGYVFYLQERVGYKNSKFLIWKFATMLKNSPNMGAGLITLKKDPRLLPIGGFLRTSKINELPQLINILLGEMSFVGPRPVMPKSFEQYPIDVQAVIYNVKPGLSGIGSIVFRDEESLITAYGEQGGDTWEFYKTKIYPFKGKLEQWYQLNQSFSTDFKIIVLTIFVIVSPKSQIIYKWFKDLPHRKL